MFRITLAAAWAGFCREGFYGAAMILGWTAAFVAALLIGLYVHNESSFDSFIPGHQFVYRLEVDVLQQGTSSRRTDGSLTSDSANLLLDFPQLEHVARLARSTRWVGQGEAKSRQRVAWVDPDFFAVLPFPAIAGDPVTAMREPDGLVLTRSLGRTLFGDSDPIGRTLLVQHVEGDPVAHPMVVRAVIQDTPEETHLQQFKLFASGLGAGSPLADADRYPPQFSLFWTYLRLRSDARASDISDQLPGFAKRHNSTRTPVSYRIEPLSDLHFTADAKAVNSRIGAIGVLILIVAGINFVTLVTARATRRAVEVGVRKAVGARRWELIVQFVGEALIYVLLALLISVMLVKIALPPVNALVERTMVFNPFANLPMAAVIAGAALLIAVVAGFYPAFVLSGFRPATALRTGGELGSSRVRQILVVVQFGILVGLIITAATISRQTSFVLQNVLKLNEDQVLWIDAPCERVFKEQLAVISGVRGVSCVSYEAESQAHTTGTVRGAGKSEISVDLAPIDVGFFEVHRLRPIAGRLFSEGRGEDMVLDRRETGAEVQPTVVLNESAMRRLGFVSPDAAVGSSIVWTNPFAVPPGKDPKFLPSRIVGVVPDFTLSTLRETIEPTMYFVDPSNTGAVYVELESTHMADTVRSIDELWRRMDHVRPIYRGFLGDDMRGNYSDVYIQGRIISASTILAILIACLGLFALAVFTTERQRKEIGIRKVNGASSYSVVRLLLWRFTKPVLLANLIGWPVAFWVSSNWLQGFAYRVSLPIWLFLGASALALLIAWVTVGTHAWLAARDRPSVSLRSE